MCGYCKTFEYVSKSGDDSIDGLISGTAWDEPITYSFPVSAATYSYASEAQAEFGRASNLQQSAVSFALDQSHGSAGNDGFSVEGFTGADISLGVEGDAHIRAAQSALPATAWAYLPGDTMQAGDVWFGTYSDIASPKAGNYGWHTVLHEMGHAMGLKHAHEGLGAFGAVSADYDTLEKTIMTYRTYEGGPINGYTYEYWGAPQTYMIADIAALQHLYGADFETNSGDTVYSWNRSEGDTFVDGKRAIDAGGDVIFATIWDGGGVDTYDLSKFDSRLTVNLEPGEASIFNDNQLSNLGRGHLASGNIYNALQYQGDVRSLIENAIGGKNRDSITGNAADNMLSGRKEADTLSGGAGDDRLLGGGGDDKLIGGAGDDVLTGGSGADVFFFMTEPGADTIVDFQNGLDKISIIAESALSITDLIANAVQLGEDVLITVGEMETITLQNFQLSNLDEQDFLI